MRPPATGERALVEGLRAGDEDAFLRLVEMHHASMLRLAGMFVPSRAVAEEVVQETWLAVIEGIHRFEGRSSLKTWLFRVLTNRAKTRGEREGRVVPFSSVWRGEMETDEPAVEAGRFDVDGYWTSPPPPAELPDERVVGAEFRELVDDAIRGLPPSQQEVITLRDVEGLHSAEVCELLGVSEGNQRVLLHRARSKVRKALESYLAEGS